MNSHLKADLLHPEARKGVELFNQGEFYKAHDPLELAWMETEPPERELYQGILLIGLAYFQILRGNYRGSIKMFIKGQRSLEPLGKTLLGVDVAKLLSDARKVEESIRRLGPDHISDLDRELIQPISQI